MNASVFFCVLLALGLASASVSDLTADNFESTVASGVWMVKFFAPWCGHCKRLAPTWDQFGNEAEGFGVAKVDCTQHQAVCQKFGVRGYPTLKLFVDGEPTDYKGQRTIPAFTSFVQSNAPSVGGPAEVEADEDFPAAAEAAAPVGDEVVVATDATFASVVASGKSLVKFYAPWCGHCKRLAPTWDELAKKNDGKFKVVKVDCTQNQKTCTAHGVRGYPTIKYFVDGEKASDYNGQRTLESFISFVDSA
eukprot:CAMPEP_0201485064 /NCGR_PEP_ID=MMETSP0151_2-20130828/9197_1 /ASSEMBLY_ACC=CAM_ASM_000257 /TAXON_ID=200890 /ORGANISM="Paramoeba atlantica, Strain 621/1 / CCAP 1560/9" /LENGTH=248 /DNA_ID=CAMNT_0047869035 /DNA_START=43 /DNA_END=789 /DNA_ORIENTATION=-